MLTDAQIERYSRQILLPEVGGRGQERLLAARVAVGGERTTAALAATLLARAGIGTLLVSASADTLPEPGPDCRLYRAPGPIEQATADVAVNLVDLTPGETDAVASGVLLGPGQERKPFVLGLRRGDRILVVTLVGAPCIRCWGQALAPGDLDGGEGARGAPHPARLALAALTASETLRVLLSRPTRGRLTAIGFQGGSACARELATEGCSCCAGTA